VIVDVEVWHWTPDGMRRGGVHDGYITVRDCERLLEEADVRRLRQQQELRADEAERRRDTAPAHSKSEGEANA
jgi:hypothetical protein